jgi:hypothetical protein
MSANFGRNGFIKSTPDLTESPQDGVHPVDALPARRALAARLVLVEHHQPKNEV